MEPLSFQEIQEIVNNKEFHKLKRDEKTQELYDIHIHKVKDKYPGVFEYVYKKLLKNVKHPVIRYNSYPYNIQNSLRHHILWDKNFKLKTQNDVHNFIKSRMLNNKSMNNVIVFEKKNSNKSVRGIPHYHIISENVVFK